MFALFFVFSLSMISLAFFFTTLINSQRVAYTASFAFLLSGVVLQAILSNVLMVYILFYPKDIQFWVIVIY